MEWTCSRASSRQSSRQPRGPGGGALTATGLVSPCGPLLHDGRDGCGAAKVHWGEPIWVTSNGAELPARNLAIATALALTEPGRRSLDSVLGIGVRHWPAVPGMLA